MRSGAADGIVVLRRAPGDDAAPDPATHPPAPAPADASEPEIGSARSPAPGQPPEPVPNPRNPAELWHPGVGWGALEAEEERLDPSEILDVDDRRDPSRRTHGATERPAPFSPEQNETVLRGRDAVDPPVSKTWHALPVSAGDGDEVVDPFHPDYALRRSAELDRQPSSPDEDALDGGPARGSSLISGPIGRTRRTDPARRRGHSLFGPPVEEDDPASAPPRTTPPHDPDA